MVSGSIPAPREFSPLLHGRFNPVAERSRSRGPEPLIRGSIGILGLIERLHSLVSRQTVCVCSTIWYAHRIGLEVTKRSSRRFLWRPAQNPLNNSLAKGVNPYENGSRRDFLKGPRSGV